MKAFAAFLAFMLPSTVFASSILAVDEPTLVDKADTVAVVSVLTSEAYNDVSGIRTRYHLQVHEGLRNCREGEVIEMDVPGGTFGEYTTVVTGTPHLATGAVVVVFLESHGASRRPLGLSYGVYRVASDTDGAWHVGREIDGLSLLGPKGRALNAQAVAAIAAFDEPYKTFVARIRQRITAHTGARP